MYSDRQPVRRFNLHPDQLNKESHPEEHLKYIREVMTRTSTFTAVPGVGAVGMGISAIVAAFLASTMTTIDAWLVTWIGEAGIGATIGLVAMIRKAQVVKTPWKSGAGRKFIASFAPSLFAGIVLTLVLWRGDDSALIPGLWMLMYGIGTVASGAFSVRIVPVMGALFVAAGALTLFLSPAWGDIMMGLTFGGLHIVFGILIAKHHGG